MKRVRNGRGKGKDPEELIGRMALSLAGKDRGRILVITALCPGREDCVLTADGYRRRAEKPKRKSLKHLRLLDPDGSCPEENAAGNGRMVQTVVISPPFTNRSLRCALRGLGETRQKEAEERNEIEEGSFCQKTM